MTAVASLSKFDAPTATDFRASVSVSSLSLADSPTASDVPTLALVGAATVPVNVSDTPTVTEATIIRTVASLSKFDQSIVTDARVMSAVSSFSAFDSPLATESLATFLFGPVIISIADSPVVVESLDIGLTILFPSIITLSGHAIADTPPLQGRFENGLSLTGKAGSDIQIEGRTL
jgi:hypothetical protein